MPVERTIDITRWAEELSYDPDGSNNELNNIPNKRLVTNIMLPTQHSSPFSNATESNHLMSPPPGVKNGYLICTGAG
jgi:hypothetical protein